MKTPPQVLTVRELEERYDELKRLRKLVGKAEKRLTDLCVPNLSGSGWPGNAADYLELAPKFEVAVFDETPELKPELEEQLAVYCKLAAALVEKTGADPPTIANDTTELVAGLK